MNLPGLVLSAGLGFLFLLVVFRPLELAYPAKPGQRFFRPAFFTDLTREIPQYWQRLVVRPGLTGFAQMRMTREESWEEKLAHDLEYVADRSVGLYLRMIAATFWRVLRQSVRAVAAMLGSLRPGSRRSRP